MDGLNNLDPEEQRQIAEELRRILEYEAENIRIAEERRAMVARGEARMIPYDEAMRMLGRG